ncbi:MAG TPA: SRPBCC domain-containing protein [Pirellulales bacterium]|jgi:uncharacterized protein YndB with AHSA1/START domain
MNQPSTVRVVVTHRYDVAPAKVFEAWLKPELLSQWMFGSHLRDETIVRLHTDACVGGSFSFVVERQGQEIDHVGEYLEVDPPRRLAFTWGIRANLPETSRVVIEIKPVATGCELALTHELDPKWSDFAPRIEASWATMLAALAKIYEQPK